MSDIVTDRTDQANDMLMAKDMADTLNAHYPGHLWAVHVQGAQGVADIRNLALSGEFGYRLRIVTNYSASEFTKRVINAGGEILERFGLRRGAASPERIAELPQRLGRVVGDYAR